jgi:HAE1 family hydrophobic/amphiphilic exporter-1
MNPIRGFVDNPVKVTVGVLVVVIFGVIGLTRMPMQLTPEVTRPTITVETDWFGRSPQEIEREIVKPQENELKSVEGLTKMSAEATNGRGQITLEFAVGTDMQKALLLVNSRLQQVRDYPEEAEQPVISTSNSSDSPIGWFILGPRVASDAEIDAFLDEHQDLAGTLEPARRATSAGLRLWHLQRIAEAEQRVADALLFEHAPLPELRRFAEDEIEARFERVPGVANANVFGGREDEIQIRFDPHKLAARKLSVLDMRDALRSDNRDTTGGELEVEKRRYTIRTLGQFDDLDDIRTTVIGYTNGSPVLIRDVAEVTYAFKRPSAIVRNFGTTSIACNALRESGANVLDVMAGLRQVIDELNETILPAKGLFLKQVYDETEYIYSAVDLVEQNIYLGGALTIIVLLLFLRNARSTLIIALAIPTSLVGTFLILQALDRSLNVISLAGLAFAVGMLVDNAVVVLENIYRHYQQGKAPVRAAVDGTREVYGAVIASTLTTLAVFIPVVFVEQEAGQLFRDIAIAISGAVGISMLVSIIVISTASAKVLKTGGAGSTRTRRGIVGWLLFPIDIVAIGFACSVLWINRLLQKHWAPQLAVVLAVIGGAVVLAWSLIPQVEYLPNGNRNLVFGVVLTPPGYNLDKQLEMGEEFEQALRDYWDLDPTAPETKSMDFPPIADFFYVAFGRQMFFGIRSGDPDRVAEIETLVQRKVGFRFPGTFIFAKQTSLFERGLAGGRNIDVEISGPDLDQLIARGQQIFGMAMEIVPGAQVRPEPSLDLSNPELHIDPNRVKAAQNRLRASDVGYMVRAMMDGSYASDYYFEGDKIDITLKGYESAREHIGDIEFLPIVTPPVGPDNERKQIPVGAVADVRVGSGPEQINRRERSRTITIKVSPPRDIPLEQALNDIRDKIIAPMRAAGQFDAPYSVALAGTADKLGEAWAALSFNFILAFVLTYLLLAALFESFTYPFVIILTVPLGVVGGLAGLQLLNVFIPQSLDVLTMLGFIILIGTVVNNAILVVHQALTLGRDGSYEPAAAIVEAVRTRIRPIFMTTTTTTFGLLPLVLFPGAGSELYRGLGSVVLGGLIVSTFFTLFLVPNVLGLFIRVRSLIARTAV